MSFVILVNGCGDLEGELDTLTISPTSATIGVSQSRLFRVTGKDEYGLIVEVDPSWSVTGGIGSISSSGLFTAGSATGEGWVVATSGEKIASAEVSITDLAWIQGRVRDSQGANVQGLRVYLYGTSFLDFTDSGGNYEIASVPAGTYEVRTQQTDVYRLSSSEVTVASGETETVNFTILFFTDPPDLNPPEFTF